MEFQLKDGWYDYIISGFLLGLFFASLGTMYSFDSIIGFPYNTYLILLFVSFVGFIGIFVMGSHLSVDTNNSTSPNNSDAYKKGYESARDTFQFSITCLVCGRSVMISDQSDISKEVKNKLKELGIRHKECQLEVKP